jgi:sugar-specific transcriptional regulator TrmB
MMQDCRANIIEARIERFNERFAFLFERYEEFAETLEALSERIEGHIEEGESILDMAREAQDHTAGKTGLKKALSVRNQGRVNSKMIGVFERNLAALKDANVLIAKNQELIITTGQTIRQDVDEMMRSVLHSIEIIHGEILKDLHIQLDLFRKEYDIEIEMAKESISKALLEKLDP